jgi:hypothetical protein
MTKVVAVEGLVRANMSKVARLKLERERHQHKGLYKREIRAKSSLEPQLNRVHDAELALALLREDVWRPDVAVLNQMRLAQRRAVAPE